MAALPQPGHQLPVLRRLRVGRGTPSRLAGTVAPVTDRAVPMSMFDYDARPVTPLPVLVGTTASGGLRTVVVEAVAPGGQAGTTSMIENYLGFPNGISGSELATRAVVQARRFGAE